MYFNYTLSCVPLRQYRACVVDSLGLGITCLISLYYVYKASRSCLLCFLCHPYIPHYNLKNFLFTCTTTVTEMYTKLVKIQKCSGRIPATLIQLLSYRNVHKINCIQKTTKMQWADSCRTHTTNGLHKINCIHRIQSLVQ